LKLFGIDPQSARLWALRNIINKDNADFPDWVQALPGDIAENVLMALKRDAQDFADATGIAILDSTVTFEKSMESRVQAQVAYEVANVANDAQTFQEMLDRIGIGDIGSMNIQEKAGDAPQNLIQYTFEKLSASNISANKKVNEALEAIRAPAKINE